MPHSFGRIFAAGIVWDPREPLPQEYLADPHYDDNWGPGSGHDGFTWAGGRRPRPGDGLTQLPPTQPHGGHFVNLKSVVPQPGTVVATTTTVKTNKIPKALPDLTVQEAGRNVLPPLSISLAASVIQDTAEVTVTQTFWNNATDPIKEASYTFPLPTGCTVTDFACRIGTNKIIRGSVKPREEAREAFKHHIRHHKTGAALLEQDTPEIFTTTLGNIPPETRLKVTLSFLAPLKHRFTDGLGTTTLTIPTYIASRYGTPPEGYKHAESANVPQGLTLKIEIIESEKVQSITSPSHGVTVDHRKGKEAAESFIDLAGDCQVHTALVQLEAGSTFLDKDFVLDIVTHPNGDNETPRAWLEEHPTLPDQHALMVTLPPKFLGQTTPAQMDEKGEILFLADQSGSMYDKVDSLKSAMQFFLKGIPLGKTFNIWSFGSNYTSWCPQSVDYNEGTLDAALAHVDKTFADDMGGTELFPAIQAVVAARDKSLMTDIIILTDGETWRLDDTLDFIQQTRIRTEGRVRFFSLGIGDGASHALVEGIAKAGGGYAEVVPSSVRNGWEDRVVSMLQASLSTAHLGPLHFDFALSDRATNTTTPVNLISPESSQRSPADISTLTPFNHNRVYFLSTTPIPRVSEDSSLTLSITSPLTPESPLSIPVVVLPKKATTIHKLAARSLLNDLERGQSHLHLKQANLYRGTWAETTAVKREAEEIACKWGLVSKWTSFFLKEEPYAPKEGSEIDLFLDGAVIKVTPGQGATGEDLLQIRGVAAVPMPAAVEEAERAVEEAVEELLLPPPTTQEARVIRVGEEDLARESESQDFYGGYATPPMRSYSSESFTYESFPFATSSAYSANASPAYPVYPASQAASASSGAPALGRVVGSASSSRLATRFYSKAPARSRRRAQMASSSPVDLSAESSDGELTTVKDAWSMEEGLIGTAGPRSGSTKQAEQTVVDPRRCGPSMPSHNAPPPVPSTGKKRRPNQVLSWLAGRPSAQTIRKSEDPKTEDPPASPKVLDSSDPKDPTLFQGPIEHQPLFPLAPAKVSADGSPEDLPEIGTWGGSDEVYEAELLGFTESADPSEASRTSAALAAADLTTATTFGTHLSHSFTMDYSPVDHSNGTHAQSEGREFDPWFTTRPMRFAPATATEAVQSTRTTSARSPSPPSVIPGETNSYGTGASAEPYHLMQYHPSIPGQDPADMLGGYLPPASSGSSRACSPASPSLTPAPAPATDPAPASEPDWIRLVLRHQKFNGAVAFPPGDPIAELLLGKEILAVVDRLCADDGEAGNKAPGSDARAFFLTLALGVILDRDFAAHARLTSLMLAKMGRFLLTECEARGDGKNRTAWHGEMKGLLVGLRVPVHVHGEGAGEEEGMKEVEPVVMQTTTAPGRELVSSAPLDE